MEIDGCLLPEDRRYDLEHDVWWHEEEGGTARLGILSTLGAFAGPFVSFAFRPVDGRVEAGRSVATMESVRYTGAVRLPVTAEIVERNPALPGRPRLLNDAPYSEGWIVRVRPVDPLPEGSPLETAEAIAARLRERIRSRHIRCWPATPDAVLYEIGSECSAVLARLNEELGRRDAGTHLLLVTDDPTSPIELVRWSDQTGYPVLAHRREEGRHEFLVRKEAHPRPRRRPEALAP